MDFGLRTTVWLRSVPGTRSRSFLLRENCPGQERQGPEDGYSVDKNPTYAHKIRQAGINRNCKIAALEVGEGRGAQNGITFNLCKINSFAC